MLLLLLPLLMMMSCASGDERAGDSNDSVASTSQPVFGNTVEDVSGADGYGPSAAVFRTVVFAQSSDGFFYAASSCSATLIKTDLLVTASHCLHVDGAAAGTPLHIAVLSPTNNSPDNRGSCTSSDPPDCVWGDPCAAPSQLPPTAYGKQGPADACVSAFAAHPDANYIMGPYDEALLFLDREIPLSVAWPVRIAVSAEPVSGYGPAYVVGFGTNAIQYNWPPIRRKGWIRNLHAREVGTATALVGGYEEGWVYESETIPEQTDITEHGDSGGGLFMDPFLVGVVSGKHDTHVPGIAGPTDFGEGIYDWWVPLYPWILDYLDDADGDGVRDSIDNCPAWRCKNSADCFNMFQEDTDGDGIGEACDDCPLVFCENNSFPTSYCYNPPWADASAPQDDMDADGIGDRCDPCPNDNSDEVVARSSWNLPYGWRLLSDDDADGVGNACDLCPGSYSYVSHHCLGSGDCAPSHSHSVACVGMADVPTLGLSGRCAEEGDSDSDGVGDRCDACPFVHDDPNLTNSNEIAELVHEADRLPDVCDEAPVASVSIPRPETLVVKAPSQQGIGEYGVLEVSEVDVSSTIGVHDPSNPPNPYAGAVEFRVCNCYSGQYGSSGSLLDCTYGGQCMKADPWVGSMYWQPTMAEATGSGFAPLPTPTIPSLQFDVGQPHSAQPAFWMWWDDSNLPERAGNWYTNSEGFRAAHMAMVSRVNRGSTPVTLQSGAESERDGLQMLRYSYAMVDAPTYKRGLPVEPSASAPAKKCYGPGCYLPVRSDLSRILPNPEERFELFDYLPNGGLVFEAGGLVTAARPGAPLTNVTTMLSASLREAIARDDMTFVSPVEAGAEVRRLGRAVQSVVVPRNWTAASQINTVISTSAGLGFAPTERALSSDLSAAQTSLFGDPLSTPVDRRAPVAVLSVRSDSVFLVGGQRPDGESSAEIWRYALRTRSWSRVGWGAAHSPETVLAATYDPDTNILYVLDEVRPLHGVKRARLIAYDTRAGSSRLLHQWPRLGLFKTLGLVLDRQRQLVLVGAQWNHVNLFRFSLKVPSAPLIGFTRLHGELLDSPFLTDDGILVPIMRKKNVEVNVTTESDFSGFSPCTAL